MQEATVALALECVGTAQQAFDISVEYAKQREQFGVPIGSFQATKHKLADLLVLLERARALGYFAALTIAEADERAAISTSMAKAAAGDAAQRIAKEGIQIHGGIGYTWEHDMHLYVRRLQSSTALFGGPEPPPPAGRRRSRASEPELRASGRAPARTGRASTTASTKPVIRSRSCACRR